MTPRFLSSQPSNSSFSFVLLNNNTPTDNSLSLSLYSQDTLYKQTLLTNSCIINNNNTYLLTTISLGRVGGIEGGRDDTHERQQQQQQQQHNKASRGWWDARWNDDESFIFYSPCFLPARYGARWGQVGRCGGGWIEISSGQVVAAAKEAAWGCARCGGRWVGGGNMDMLRVVVVILRAWNQAASSTAYDGGGGRAVVFGLLCSFLFFSFIDTLDPFFL